MAAISSPISLSFNPLVKFTPSEQERQFLHILHYLDVQELSAFVETCKAFNRFLNNFPSNVTLQKQYLSLRGRFRRGELIVKSETQIEEAHWESCKPRPDWLSIVGCSNFTLTLCRSFPHLQSLGLYDLTLSETLKAPSDYSLTNLRILYLSNCILPLAPLKQLFQGSSQLRMLGFLNCSFPSNASYQKTLALLPHLHSFSWNSLHEPGTPSMPLNLLSEMLEGASLRTFSFHSTCFSTVFPSPKRMLPIAPTLEHVHFGMCSNLHKCKVNEISASLSSCTIFGIDQIPFLPLFPASLANLALECTCFDWQTDPQTIKHAAPQLKELVFNNVTMKNAKSNPDPTPIFQSSLHTLRFVRCERISLTKRGLTLNDLFCSTILRNCLPANIIIT